MKNKVVVLLVLISTFWSVYAQNDELINCDTNIVVGQNLIVNGGFEDGDAGFSVPGYTSWNKLTTLPEYSIEKNYWVSENIGRFNDAFSGSPYEGSKFLMVDGECKKGSIVWEQQVNIAENTRYFFQVYIASIYNLSTAILRFEIDGEILPDTIVAPPTPGSWVSFVDDSWYSGNRSGLVTIRIRNDQTINCEDGNDFALDNISFSAGCFFGDEGEVPELGPNLSLCGTEGKITLSPKIPTGPNYRYLWSTSDDDTLSSITVTKPGVYAICMTTDGSCVKSDKIRINQNFEIELGDDNAICREIRDTLSVSHSGPLVSYKWYKDGSLIPGATDSVYVPTEVGTYSVQVWDGAANCGSRTDSMNLSKGVVTIDLGSAQELCRPGHAILNPGYEGIGYEWYLNGQRLGDLTTQEVEVNQVGEYRVVVKDAICDDVEDVVQVTSKTFIGENANFCPGATSGVALSISNTPSAPENYIWYADEALTVQVGSGLTFTTPDTLTQTTSYYVKDQSIFQGTVGPLANANTSNNNPYGDGESNKYIAFDLTNDIILDSVLVFPMYNQNFNVGFAVYDRNTNALVTSKVVPVSLPANPGSNNLRYPTYISLDLSLPAGQYYVKNTGTTGQLHYNQGQWTPSFPYKDADGILSIIGLSPSEQWQAALYGYFYDWHFSTGTVCDPVEVKAVYDPFVCAGCVSPNDAEVVITGGVNPITCNTGPVTLEANVVGGIGNWTYSWTKDGLPLSDTTATITVPFEDAGTYIVTAADSSNPNICYGLSSPFIVRTSIPEIPIVRMDASLNLPTCLISTISVDVTTQNFETVPTVFEWSVNGQVDNSSTTNTIDLDLNDGDLLKVSVSGNDGCGNPITATDSVIIQEEKPVTPTVNISPISTCEGETVEVIASISPSGLATGASYTWAVGTKAEPISTSNTFESIFENGDSVSVSVSVAADGCLATRTASNYTLAEIYTALVPSVAISANKNDICANELPIRFSVTSIQNGGTTPAYQWYIGSEPQTNETKVEFTSSDINNGDTVSVVMTSSLSCVTAPTTSDSIYDIVIKPMVDVSVDLDKIAARTCAGASIDFAATVNPIGTTGSYQWKVNDTDQGTDQSAFSDVFDNGDRVTVVFTPTIECPLFLSVSATTPAVVTIDEPSVTIASITSGMWCHGKVNGFEVISSSLGGNSPSFKWDLVRNGITTTQPETGDSITRNNFLTGDTIKIEMITSAPDDACTNPTDFAVVGTFESPEDVTIGLSALTFCEADEYTISANGLNHGAGAKYTWKLNTAELVDTVNFVTLNDLIDGDTIKVAVQSSETCVNFDTASTQGIVILIPTPEVVLGAKEIILSDYEEVTLDATKSELSGATYSWSSSDSSLYEVMTGRFSTVAKVTPELTQTKFYFNASRTENGTTCKDVDSINVIVDYSFVIPNAFTPNGDGLNDAFQIANLEKLDAFRLQIFNRWGTLLYEQKGLSDFWDGTYNGNPVPVATYYYVFEYEMNGEEQKPKKDFISLIR